MKWKRLFFTHLLEQYLCIYTSKTFSHTFLRRFFWYFILFLSSALRYHLSLHFIFELIYVYGTVSPEPHVSGVFNRVLRQWQESLDGGWAKRKVFACRRQYRHKKKAQPNSERDLSPRSRCPKGIKATRVRALTILRGTCMNVLCNLSRL